MERERERTLEFTDHKTERACSKEMWRKSKEPNFRPKRLEKSEALREERRDPPPQVLLIMGTKLGQLRQCAGVYYFFVALLAELESAGTGTGL